MKLFAHLSIISLMVVGLNACQTVKYEPVSPDLPTLNVSFADSQWTGNAIPKNQHCKMFGGKGATPALNVSGIPAGTNAIIVEFNDESYAPLSSDGGHGKIGFWVTGSSAQLKPVMGGTDQMPEGVFLESKNRARGKWSSPGYLPPCSGGRGNFYSADIKAVYKAQSAQEKSKLLAVGEISLGSY